MRPSAIVDYQMAILAGDQVAALRVLHREFWFWDSEYRRAVADRERTRALGFADSDWADALQAKALAEREPMVPKWASHFPAVNAVPGYETLEPEDIFSQQFPTPEVRGEDLRIAEEVARAGERAEDYSGRGGAWEQFYERITTRPLEAPLEAAISGVREASRAAGDAIRKGFDDLVAGLTGGMPGGNGNGAPMGAWILGGFAVLGGAYYLSTRGRR